MFTVDTKIISPNVSLQQYIRCFAVRKFDSGTIEFPKVMFADHEMTMVFFLNSSLFGFEAFSEKEKSYVINKNSQCCFTGVLTSTKGFIIFKGPVTILNIHFKPTGFFHLFSISPKELIDKMDDNKSILSNEILLIHEQMHYAKSIKEIIEILQHYLIKKLSFQKDFYKHKGIYGASELLVKSGGTYPIKKLASDCNMTLQTFEVQFEEQVGISPKFFSKLYRFGKAVNMKLYQPQNKWSIIANTCGYYDQMHLIKDFKQFTSLVPQKFMKEMHPPYENFT